MKTIICAVAFLFSSAHAMGKIDETCPTILECNEGPCFAGEFCAEVEGVPQPFCLPCLKDGESLPCDERAQNFGQLTSAGLADCQACCGL